MELLLKRSQTSLPQIQTAISRYFVVERILRGRHEWIEGELRKEPGLGKQDPEEEARVSIDVPYDEKEKKTLMTKILSPFSGTLYRIRLQNLNLTTTLAVIKELQGLGVDVGFTIQSGAAMLFGPSESVDFPGNPEAELSKASELCELSVENLPHKTEHRVTQPPPYQLCGGIPSSDLCPRCKYNILRGGKTYCSKYKKTTTA